MKTKVVKFKDWPAGKLILGGWPPDFTGVRLQTYQLHRMNGKIMRSVGQAIKRASMGAKVSEAIYAASLTIVKDIGGFTQVQPIFDNLIVADRQMILVQSKIDDDPIQVADARCPLPTNRSGTMGVCDKEVKIPFDYREIGIRVPEDEEQIVWFKDRYPCFRFSAPELGLESSLIRYPTIGIERDSYLEGRPDSGNQPYYVLAQSIMEWNGKSLDPEEAKRLRRVHWFKDEEAVAELEKPLLKKINEAYKANYIGPEAEANVKCAGCGGRFPYEPETISHFL